MGISANEPSAARNGTVEAVAPARVRGASRGARLETTDRRIEERPRGWVARDPLRRRILALADVCTVGAVSATLAVFGPGLSAALGALLFLPGFILAAKLCAPILLTANAWEPR